MTVLCATTAPLPLSLRAQRSNLHGNRLAALAMTEAHKATGDA